MSLDEIDLRTAAFFFDIDGTLLDIAPTPQDVRVPPRLKQALVEISKQVGGALAFISGRPLADIDRIFDPLKFPAIGGHGAEIRLGADGAEVSGGAQLDPKLRHDLAAIATRGAGIVIEDKGYAFALHFRLAPQHEQMVIDAVEAICAASPTPLELLPGKSVIEVKQPAFNKGTGLRFVMKHPPFHGRRPVFVGDDVTDEAAFRVMPEFDGIGLSVGRELPGVSACFQTPSDVRRWLYRMARVEGAAEQEATV